MILCGVMSGVFMTYWGWPVWAGVLGAVLFGGLLGFVNGFNVSVLGLPPFIATLGMMLISAGLSLVISGTKPIYFKEHPGFQLLMNFSVRVRRRGARVQVVQGHAASAGSLVDGHDGRARRIRVVA